MTEVLYWLGYSGVNSLWLDSTSVSISIFHFYLFTSHISFSPRPVKVDGCLAESGSAPGHCCFVLTCFSRWLCDTLWDAVHLISFTLGSWAPSSALFPSMLPQFNWLKPWRRGGPASAIGLYWGFFIFWTFSSCINNNHRGHSEMFVSSEEAVIFRVVLYVFVLCAC